MATYKKPNPFQQPHLYVLGVIKARFSCILVNFTCRFEDSPSVPTNNLLTFLDTIMHL